MSFQALCIPHVSIVANANGVYMCIQCVYVVCMYVCMHVCMYVCMYMYMCIIYECLEILCM